jgi:nucleoid-associated protein YgaU
MIEVVYKEEKKKPVGNQCFFKIPRNIRQIGEVDEDYKIYIEDYAYHYLDRMKEEKGKVALLLGQANWAEGVAYIFIKSAFYLEEMEVDVNHISFDEKIWSKANQIMEASFPNQEVVGWCFSMPECPMEITDAMFRAHMDYFGGNEKVFFLREPLDHEEVFFRYDNGKICRQQGFYLYYERNEAMQEFMVEDPKNVSIEGEIKVEDRAVKDFREIISGKKENGKKEKKEKGSGWFVYASAAAAILLALSLGTNYLSDYKKLEDAGQMVEELTTQTGEDLALAEEETDGENIEKIENVENIEVEEADTREVAAETASATLQPEEEEKEAEKVEETATKEETGEERKEEDNGKEENPDSQEEDQDETKTTAATHVSYIIQEGDTLTSISRQQYGDTTYIDEICRLNQISKDTVIYPGEIILLP